MVLIVTIVALVVVGIILLVVLFNRLTAAQNLVQAAFGDIDVQLQRRSQLIPNLVALTKGYAQHEAELLEEIAGKRTTGGSLIQKAEEDENLFRVIRRINVLAENYPELKASDPFMRLMEQLSGIEKDLMSSRRFYNGTVRIYNTKIQSFPSNFVAGISGMKAAEFYIVAHDDQREPINTNTR